MVVLGSVGEAVFAAAGRWIGVVVVVWDGAGAAGDEGEVLVGSLPGVFQRHTDAVVKVEAWVENVFVVQADLDDAGDHLARRLVDGFANFDFAAAVGFGDPVLQVGRELAFAFVGEFEGDVGFARVVVGDRWPARVTVCALGFVVFVRERVEILVESLVLVLEEGEGQYDCEERTRIQLAAVPSLTWFIELWNLARRPPIRSYLSRSKMVSDMIG